MEVLTGATGTNIERSCFSNVRRNQYNHCTIHQTIIDKRAKINKNLPELSEFTEVKRGDIYKDNSVCYSWQLCSNGMDDTKAVVYHAEINIVGPFGQKKYTVKTYHGRSGKKEWQRDFLRCSRDWHQDVPLFGYNKSSVPSLIFHGELVPIAHVEAQAGGVGRLYFEMLKNVLRCSRNELWMDPTRGRFCRGPVGPECHEWFNDYDVTAIPSDVDFLREDVLIRYLSSIKHDLGLVSALNYSNQYGFLEEVSSSYCPHVISSLTHSTIAFNRNVRWFSRKGCLCNKQGMAGHGATRFLLTDHGRSIQVESISETFSWLSQALSVFYVHNLQFDEDLSNLKLVFPSFKLKGTLHGSKHKCQRRQSGGLIYLFLLPSPSPNTHFYFWSHDPSGQDPLSPDMCKYLGLPITLPVTLDYYQYSWPTKTYKTLHNYQVVRGFDPTTTDFAQSLGHSIFEVMSPENRFQEVDIEEVNNTADSNYGDGEDDGQVGFTSIGLVQETTGGSLLNKLSSWFVLDAVESSGISAVAF